MKTKQQNQKDLNADPITGEPGAHPVGVGLGTAGGATAGAAIGAIGGPVGAVAGAIVGGIAGAAAGKAGAEAMNPTEEDRYWRTNHASRDYADADFTYDDYRPAYRMGYEGAAHQGKTWDEAESSLEREWEATKNRSSLGWDKAKHAVRAGWQRVENRFPGDSDSHGR